MKSKTTGIALPLKSSFLSTNMNAKLAFKRSLFPK